MKSFPFESRACTDLRTGARVRQVTNHPSIHHHPFYYLPLADLDALLRQHAAIVPENGNP